VQQKDPVALEKTWHSCVVNELRVAKVTVPVILSSILILF